jgi:hypothetical protein
MALSTSSQATQKAHHLASIFDKINCHFDIVNCFLVQIFSHFSLSLKKTQLLFIFIVTLLYSFPFSMSI